MDRGILKEKINEARGFRLYKVLLELPRCDLNNGGRRNPLWTKVFDGLKDAVNSEWPGAVNWNGGLYVMNDGHDHRVPITRKVAREFVRCIAYTNKWDLDIGVDNGLYG